ncbi:predicted protein [Histoplasma mississippiense (nom. inval.)]|uniref:predicted protein n=1 Tax=Ajellomyces capsulatus (strain NAm1 / WU24) TaxID=2059318 RepID=UPI000157C33A|nr:predicted protein [Histoplasma mississippiense (nom. inval.)]EDN07251.1 predicted protein [Histoplasma mississippiense (nom. inval.)]
MEPAKCSRVMNGLPYTPDAPRTCDGITIDLTLLVLNYEDSIGDVHENTILDSRTNSF